MAVIQCGGVSVTMLEYCITFVPYTPANNWERIIPHLISTNSSTGLCGSTDAPPIWNKTKLGCLLCQFRKLQFERWFVRIAVTVEPLNKQYLAATRWIHFGSKLPVQRGSEKKAALGKEIIYCLYMMQISIAVFKQLRRSKLRCRTFRLFRSLRAPQMKVK